MCRYILAYEDLYGAGRLQNASRRKVRPMKIVGNEEEKTGAKLQEMKKTAGQCIQETSGNENET